MVWLSQRADEPQVDTLTLRAAIKGQLRVQSSDLQLGPRIAIQPWTEDFRADGKDVAHRRARSVQEQHARKELWGEHHVYCIMNSSILVRSSLASPGHAELSRGLMFQYSSLPSW